MQSDPNNLDDLFRKKESEAEADLTKMPEHLKELRSMMPYSMPRQSLRKYLVPVAASFLLLGSLAIVATERYKTKNSISSAQKNTSPLTGRKLTDTLGPNLLTTATKITASGAHTPRTGNTVRVVPVSKNPNLETAYTSSKAISARVTETETKTVISSLPEVAIDNAKVLEQFLDALKPMVQSFTIDNERDTLIQCKEGTRLFIPAGSFETMAGGKAISNIQIEVTEHYNFSDMVGDKLTTTSGDKRLITAGMIHIKASSANQELKIKNNKSLDLKMPGKVDARMQLFTGDRIKNQPSSETADEAASEENGAINWTAQGQQQLYYGPRHKNVKVVNFADNASVSYHTRKNWWTGEVVSTRSIARYRIRYNATNSNTEILEIMKKKYGKRYDEIKVRREWKPLTKRNRLADLFYDPKWYDDNTIGDSVLMNISRATRLGLITVEDSMKHELRWKKELEEMTKQQQLYEKFRDETAEYSFKINRMGWINCDRFYNYPAGRLTEFLVTSSEEINFSFSQSLLVFKRDKSVLSCEYRDGKLKTPPIPLGSEVTVVSMGTKDGKVYTSVQDFKVTRESSSKIEYRLASAAEFKEQLRSLGSVVERG